LNVGINNSFHAEIILYEEIFLTKCVSYNKNQKNKKLPLLLPENDIPQVSENGVSLQTGIDIP